MLRLPGRPKWLTDAEEANLFRAIVALRRHGCIVDNETIVVMALATVNLSGVSDRLLPLTVHWSKALRQRLKLGRMQKPTTVRPPLTAANWDAVNKWRKDLGDIRNTLICKLASWATQRCANPFCVP